LLPFAFALTGKTPQPRYATLAEFKTADGNTIDSGLLLYFPDPHSFTGEDVLELQGHGGPVVMQMLLGALPRPRRTTGRTRRIQPPRLPERQN
jgi:tRNA modification GTPase